MSKRFTEHMAYSRGFRFEANEEKGMYRISYDCGQQWAAFPLYNAVGTVKRHQINHFYVKRVLQPTMGQGELLCHLCANEGKVGIARFSGYVDTYETETRLVFDEFGEPTEEDVKQPVRIEEWRCTTCNYLAHSDYASIWGIR